MDIPKYIFDDKDKLKSPVVSTGGQVTSPPFTGISRITSSHLDTGDINTPEYFGVRIFSDHKRDDVNAANKNKRKASLEPFKVDSHQTATNLTTSSTFDLGLKRSRNDSMKSHNQSLIRSSNTKGSKTSLELEVNRLKARLEEERSEASMKISRAESHARNAQLKADQLGKQLERMTKDEESIREELRNKELEFLKEKHDLESQMRNLDKQLRTSQSDLLTEREAARETIKEFEETKEELRSKYTILVKQNATLEQHIEELANESNASNMNISLMNSQNQDYLSRTESLELLSVVNRLKRENRDLLLKLEASKSGGYTSEAVNSMREKLINSEQNCRKIQAELQKSSINQTLILEKDETIKALKGELERIQERSGQMVAAEVERDALLSERRDWDRQFLKLQNEFSAMKNNRRDASIDENCQLTGTSVQQAIKFLHDLQNECVFLTKSKGNTELQLKKCERELNSCRQRLLESQQKVASVEDSKSQMEDSKVAAEKECLYLRREVNSLLRVIESTGKEASLTSSSGGSNSQNSTMDKIDNRQKVDALEKQLANAKDRIKELEVEGVTYRREGASPAVARTSRKQIEELQKQVLVYENEKQKLTTELEKAQAKVAELEHHVTTSKGTYSLNIGKEKVVHMTMNPERELRKAKSKNMEEEVKRLRKVNEELTEKINDILGNTNMAAGNFSPVTAASQQDLGKRHERLKELFKQKTKAFREAVYLLTGFMIDMTQDQNPQLRVRSMFAEREDDHLLFKWQPDVEGGLHLLETDFCSRIDENIFAYLKKCNSVPAFLSTLTLDLFEKQTFLL